MPDPTAPRIPRDKWPAIPPAAETRLPTNDERETAQRVLHRETPVALPTTVDGLRLEHLPEGDEHDLDLAVTAVKVAVLRAHPEDQDVIVFHALAPGLGNDECPGWVHGVGTIVSALAMAGREAHIRKLFRAKLGEMGLDLSRAPQDLVRQVDQAAAQAAVDEQDRDDQGDGGPYVAITRRKLARRRRIALGLPFDPKAHRKDTRALIQLRQIVGEYLDGFIASARRR